LRFANAVSAAKDTHMHTCGIYSYMKARERAAEKKESERSHSFLSFLPQLGIKAALAAKMKGLLHKKQRESERERAFSSTIIRGGSSA